MKSIYYIIYLLIFLSIIGCSNKKEELSKLMQHKRYSEARSLLKTLSTEELNNPEISLYKDTLNFIEIDSIISFYNNKNAFLSIDSLINITINSITNSTQLKDSLLSLKEFYAFRGAQYYNSLGANNNAFKCIQQYLGKPYFSIEQNKIINQILKNRISGQWIGVNVASKKILIGVELNALTSRTFKGILDFKGQPWDSYQRLIIDNCVFDGFEFSAQAFVLKFDRWGRTYKGAQSTLVGDVSNDTLHLTIDLNRYLIPDGSTQWILTRK